SAAIASALILPIAGSSFVEFTALRLSTSFRSCSSSFLRSSVDSCASRGEAIKASAAATIPNRTMISPFDTKTRSLIHLRKELPAPLPAPRLSKEDASPSLPIPASKSYPPACERFTFPSLSIASSPGTSLVLPCGKIYLRKHTKVYQLVKNQIFTHRAPCLRARRSP